MANELKLDIIKDMENIIKKMNNGYQVKLDNVIDKIYYLKFIE